TQPVLGWEALWLPLGEGEGEGLPHGRGEGWEPIAVPAQQWARAGRSALWYRAHLPRPDHDGRVILRIGGAFLAANCWLNGRFLGSHYGYFAPFGFDLTPYLRQDNLLVICCESPIETDLARKRHVMGMFNDGDGRPYPDSAWFSLPSNYRWEVPIGLWQPVWLEYTGSVIIDRLRIKPRLEAGDAGRLEIEVQARSLDGRKMPSEVEIEVEGPNVAQPLRLRREFSLAGGAHQSIELALPVTSVERWWPWRLGEQPLYTVRVAIHNRGRESVRVEERFGFHDVVVEAGAAGWRVMVNGVPLFLRGATYAPSLQLDHLNEELFRRDLQLAKETNIDLLRISGHILPEEFYRLADEAGILVIADFPLTRSYAYHASANEKRFFENAVRSQLPEMVGLLGNRTSIMLWGGHHSPPWIEANQDLGDVHAIRQNYTIDQEIRSTLEELDPTRLALAASGEFDQHLWRGWREGEWSDFGELLPGLVSEFGAQALPEPESPAWEALGRRWPVEADDPRWLYAGFQPQRWAERGVGLPEDYESLETFIEASQDYQAWLCSYAIDQLRKRKFEPCWGAIVATLADSFSGIGCGLVDAARHPKLALEAVQEAFAPLRLIIDPVGFQPLLPFGIGWRAGEEAVIRLVVVNDAPELAGEAEVEWVLIREEGEPRSGLGRLADALGRRSWRGRLSLNLPTFQQPALQLKTLNFSLLGEGDYRFEAELRLPAAEPLHSGFSFLVAERLPVTRPVNKLPAYLTERLIEEESLRAVPEGISFTLRNRTRPAVLTSLSVILIDGRALAELPILIDAGGGKVPFSRRVDLPVGRAVTVVVELEQPLEPGQHELELELSVAGLASGRAVVRGEVSPIPST
ncbi:MAG: glycoside hydrolase family 2 protein, partial [Candidatus Dormibacteraceae bacterium]